MGEERPALGEGSVVFLVDGEGGILLQQRDDETPPAGYGRWGIPGGRREGTETPAETARREMHEEIGVELGHLRCIGVATPEDTEGLRARLHLFVSEDVVARAVIEVNEGLDFQYWTPADAAALPMNPPTRKMLERFIAGGHYAALRALRVESRVGAAVIEIDRWGRLLLQLRDEGIETFPGYWTVPGGGVERGESPDAAAFREFEEETGHLLDTIRLFKVYRRATDLPAAMVDVQHVYYIDADIDEEAIVVGEGQAFRYFAPAELEGLKLTPYARHILAEFVGSTAYRGMFH